MRDPYLYPNSTVLKNLATVKEQDRLNEMEAEYCSFRLSQLITNASNVDTTVEGLCGIHYYIFQDVYEWAGKFRTINIEKSEPALGGISIEYSEYGYIEEELKLILEEMERVEWSCLELKELTKVFSENMANILKVHPFREGSKIKDIVRELLYGYGISVENQSLQAGIYLFRKYDGKIGEISKHVLLDEMKRLYSN